MRVYRLGSDRPWKVTGAPRTMVCQEMDWAEGVSAQVLPRQASGCLRGAQSGLASAILRRLECGATVGKTASDLRRPEGEQLLH